MKKFLPTKSLGFTTFSPHERGFTLIELLVALTIVTILAVAVYVALNPAQRLKDAKDARRAADVDTILAAIHTSIVDSKGSLPTGLTAGMTEQQLGTGALADCPAAVGTYCSAMATSCVNLLPGGAQNLSKYLASMPSDPGTTDNPPLSTGYSVKVDSNGIVTIKACYTDGAAVVSASR